MFERALIQAIHLGTDLSLRAAGFQSRTVPTTAGPLHALSLPGRAAGPPLMLFHGLGSRATDYVPLMRSLADITSHLTALDLPGHGRSPSLQPTTDLHPVRLATIEATNQLLDRPAVLFGNSLGGLVAVRYALAHPERVLGLMLVNPGGAPLEPAELSALLAQFRMPTRADAERFLDALLGHPSPARSLLAWGLRRRLSRPGTRHLINNITPADLLRPEELSSLRPPTFFFWGRRDTLLPDSNRRFYREHLPPTSRLEEHDPFGHVPYLDNPRAFLPIVRDYLRTFRP